MRIEILYRILNVLVTKIESTSIIQSATNLMQVTLPQNIPANNQNRTAYGAQINDIQREIFNHLTLELQTGPGRTYEEQEVFDFLNIDKILGEEGIQAIANLSNQNAPLARQNLDRFIQEMARWIALRNSLSSYASKIHDDRSRDNADIIKIIFKGQTLIKTLQELSKRANVWNQDLVAFARLAGDNDTNFRVEGVEKGSLIITIGASVGIIFTLAKTLDKIYDLIEKHLKVRDLVKTSKEVRPIISDSVIEQLEQSARLNISQEAGRISEELIKNRPTLADGEKNEINNHLTIAVGHLIEFVNSGGGVELNLISTESEKTQLSISLSVKRQTITEKGIAVNGSDTVPMLDIDNSQSSIGTGEDTNGSPKSPQI